MDFAAARQQAHMRHLRSMQMLKAVVHVERHQTIAHSRSTRGSSLAWFHYTTEEGVAELEGPAWRRVAYLLAVACLTLGTNIVERRVEPEQWLMIAIAAAVAVWKSAVRHYVRWRIVHDGKMDPSIVRFESVPAQYRFGG